MNDSDTLQSYSLALTASVGLVSDDDELLLGQESSIKTCHNACNYFFGNAWRNYIVVIKLVANYCTGMVITKLRYKKI